MKSIIHVIMSFVFIVIFVSADSISIEKVVAAEDLLGDIRVLELESKLDIAVKRQRFEEAIVLRDKIKILKLQNKLDIAVRGQNFEEAIILRDKIKKIKNADALSAERTEGSGGSTNEGSTSNEENKPSLETQLAVLKKEKEIAEIENKLEEFKRLQDEINAKEVKIMKARIAAKEAFGSEVVDSIKEEVIKPGPLRYKEAGKKESGLRPVVGFFQPSARVYFDTGSDDKSEIDIFEDGALVPTISLAQIYFPYEYPKYFGTEEDLSKKWTWGPTLGVGLSSPANNSDDGTNKSSDAPIILLSGGLLLRFPVGDGKRSVDLEGGYAQGFSADEGLDDTTDGAAFMGVGINLW